MFFLALKKEMKRRTLLKTLGLIGLGSSLPNSLFSKESPSTNRHFIGLGGAGTNFLAHANLKGLKGKYTSINVQIRSEYESKINWIPFKLLQTNKGKIQSGFDRNLSWENFTNCEIVKENFLNQDNYVLVAGIGGLTGTFLIRTLLKELLDADIPFKAIVFLPFHFERANEQQNIRDFVEKYSDVSAVNFIDLEQYKKNYGQLSMTEFFDKIHEEICYEL